LDKGAIDSKQKKEEGLNNEKRGKNCGTKHLEGNRPPF
jgi:hypothetical protein